MSRGGTPLTGGAVSSIIFVFAVEASHAGKRAFILKFAHGFPLSWILPFTESRLSFRPNTQMFYTM